MKAVQAAGSETLTLDLERDGEARRLTIRPRLEEGKGFVGVGPAYAVQRWGPGEAVGQALLATWDKTAMTLGLVKKMVQGLVSTSNLSNELFDGWGWGEVVPDGIGVAYSTNRDVLLFNVTSARGFASPFCQFLEDAVRDMISTLEGAGKSKL